MSWYDQFFVERVSWQKSENNILGIINYRYWTFQDFFTKEHNFFIRITPLVCKISHDKEHNTKWLSINTIYPQLSDSQLSSVHKQKVERTHHSTDATSSVSALYLTLRLHVVCVTGTSYKLCGLNVVVICHVFWRLHPSNCPSNGQQGGELLVGLNRN